MKNIFLLAILGLITITSCKKENFERFNPSTGGFEAKQVTASYAGIIVDASEQGLEGVAVSIGSNNTMTDENGAFFFKNISVPNTKAYFTAKKSGFFLGTRTVFSKEGSTHQIRIKMLDNSPIGSFQNNAGGVVTLAEGGQLTFEEGDVALPNGDPYTGQVNVAAKRIDPTTANGRFEMPGDLRGVDKEENDVTLASYGMMAVELTDNSGNLLQVAPGQTVDISFEVPSSLVATAPTDIPLWYFDEVNGQWKEDGTATLSGNIYSGKVGHFSFWNCDANFPRVYFEATFVNESGQPLVNAWIGIELPNGIRRYAVTNDDGWVGGEVMANATMKVYFAADLSCSQLSQYIMDFTTTNLDVDLGNIVVTVNEPVSYTISGTLVDCNDNPVSNGYIQLKSNLWYFAYNTSVNTDGTFSFDYTTCAAIDSIFLTGYDYVNLEQSELLGYDLTQSTDLGNVKACGIILDEFITYNFTTISGNDTTLTAQPPMLLFSDTLGTEWFLSGSTPDLNMNFWLLSSTQSTGTYAGTASYEGTSGSLFFDCDFTITSFPSNFGEYIQGSFMSNNITPVVTGSFRVKK